MVIRHFSSMLTALLVRSVLVLPLQSSTATADVLTDIEHVLNKTYDFVICGGGTAGLVLAARLSEIPSLSILVIEDGVSNLDVLDVQVPFLGPGLFADNPSNWNYTTTPQQFGKGRRLVYPRGRGWGGSSAINLLTYSRASDSDWDEIVRRVEDDRWASENMDQYYRKSQTLVQPAGNPNTTGEVDPADFGFGPVDISAGAFFAETDQRVLETARQNPDIFPFNGHLAGGVCLGFDVTQNTVDHASRRSYSEPAYLVPALNQHRRNLDILPSTRVTRLISSGTKFGKPTLDTVEIATSNTSTRYTVKAEREVILSAGAINSPMLLQLSGIGNATELKQLGIGPLVDNPEVGILSDHPLVPIYFNLTDKATTFDALLRNKTALSTALNQWNTTGTGRLSSPAATSYGFLRLPPDSPIIAQYGDISNGPDSPHFEFLFLDGYVPFGDAVAPDTGNYLTIVVATLAVSSRGTVTLTSPVDPFAPPAIDPAYLSTPVDRATTLSALRTALTFHSLPPWADLITGPLDPRTTLNASDAELQAYVEESLQTLFHPMGTVGMGPSRRGTGGVLDSRFRVKGCNGVRVVDASVFPVVLGGHPVSAVYALAERAVRVILGDLGVGE